MAHIQIRGNGDGTTSIVVNGIDFSFEAYDDAELVAVGDPDMPEWCEIGLRLTIGVGRLDVEDADNVPLTEHMDAANELIRAVREKARQIRDGEIEPEAPETPKPPLPDVAVLTRSGI